jgi:hypothetical protein
MAAAATTSATDWTRNGGATAVASIGVGITEFLGLRNVRATTTRDTGG